MTADVQGVLAVAIVAGAALYTAKRAWSAWRVARPASTGERPSGCGSDCDCR
ncbi:MAG TPA: hypothetical protein VFS59_04380 [Gemmatimonadaceae bacterium]|nr:hypothetical protein [Gemmatimonadaceae bacterium]